MTTKEFKERFKYSPADLLGKGGYGTVYKSFDTLSNKLIELLNLKIYKLNKRNF